MFFTNLDYDGHYKNTLILWKIRIHFQAFSNLWEEAAAKKKISWLLQDNHFCNYSSMGILKEFYIAVTSAISEVAKIV